MRLCFLSTQKRTVYGQLMFIECNNFLVLIFPSPIQQISSSYPHHWDYRRLCVYVHSFGVYVQLTLQKVLIHSRNIRIRIFLYRICGRIELNINEKYQNICTRKHRYPFSRFTRFACILVLNRLVCYACVCVCVPSRMAIQMKRILTLKMR